MSADVGGGRLKESAKRALLDTMRRTAPEGRDLPSAAAAAGRDMSFDSLPAYQQLRSQRGLAEALGLRFPFYRTHDARAGARSVIDGERVVNFASYDYLGLNGHPEITAAVAEATAAWGTSVSASRITAGERIFIAIWNRRWPASMRAKPLWLSSAGMQQRCLRSRRCLVRRT